MQDLANSISLKQKAFTFGPPLLIILTSVILASTSLISSYPGLAAGITYDLTITAPLVYFLLIRKKRIPKITVLSVALAGIFIAWLILPQNHRYHFDLITSILLPVIELVVFSTIFYYSWQTVREARKSSEDCSDMYRIIQGSAEKAIGYPRIAKIITSEIAVFYYSFFAWKSRPLNKNEYSYHRKTGIIALLSVIIFLSLVEGFVVHLLVERWRNTVAWVLTVLSLYSGLMIFAHIKAILKRPHVLKENCLELKSGLFGHTAIPYANIRRIELSSGTVEDETLKVRKLSPLAELEPHNLIIHLHQEGSVEIVYGISRPFNVLLVQVDDVVSFKALVEERIDSDYKDLKL